MDEQKETTSSMSGAMCCVDILVLNKGLGLMKEDKNGGTGKGEA